MTYRTDARDVWVDPVSHEPVDPQQPNHQSFYNGHMYHFTARVNKETFDEDPQLWISTPHATQNSASLNAVGEAT